MDSEYIRALLHEKKIVFSETTGEFELEVQGCKVKICNDMKIRVLSNMFGIVPHIMEDGTICTAGNQSISYSETDKNILEIALFEYLPWLLSMSPQLKLTEIMNEFEYYCRVLFSITIQVMQKKPALYRNRVIFHPQDLWEAVLEMEDGFWYRFDVNDTNGEKIFLHKVSGFKVMQVYRDLRSRASERVLGKGYKNFDRKSCFIGIGSVNSYLIKKLVAHGLSSLVVIDDQKVESGNSFRFAFPYKGMYKVNCVKRFASLVSSDINVVRYRKRINENSRDSLDYLEYVFISVDNPFSWYNSFNYAVLSAPKSSIVLCGIDIYGSFGKFIVISGNKSTPEKNALFAQFMRYEKAGERKPMVGNGCGNSVAIYSEKNLIDFIDKIFDSIVSGMKVNTVLTHDF